MASNRDVWTPFYGSGQSVEISSSNNYHFIITFTGLVLLITDNKASLNFTTTDDYIHYEKVNPSWATSFSSLRLFLNPPSVRWHTNRGTFTTRHPSHLFSTTYEACDWAYVPFQPYHPEEKSSLKEEVPLKHPGSLKGEERREGEGGNRDFPGKLNHWSFAAKSKHY